MPQRHKGQYSKKETNRSTKYLTVTLVHKEYISIFKIYMPSANEAAQFLEINNLLIKKTLQQKKIKVLIQRVNSLSSIHFLENPKSLQA